MRDCCAADKSRAGAFPLEVAAFPPPSYGPGPGVPSLLGGRLTLRFREAGERNIVDERFASVDEPDAVFGVFARELCADQLLERRRVGCIARTRNRELQVGQRRGESDGQVEVEVVVGRGVLGRGSRRHSEGHGGGFLGLASGLLAAGMLRGGKSGHSDHSRCAALPTMVL